ncbi:uncharacterized protein ssp [Drosophila bipectinata]|uniref:uncharacterized protein ssp n=1 Tax=Drosophila bipectinata TaxID=42026 RepID=UPI001C89A05E|nr:uncharacterized protein LOC108120418 [Drosophila bipectinata]XP_043070116.1 uncharacterized protein LOC108120418 [Drosophila bipectinata]
MKNLKESSREVALKVFQGEYKLLDRQQRSTVWKVFQAIVRDDGTMLKNCYFCTGCKRVMRGYSSSNFRTHMCHVKYIARMRKESKDHTETISPEKEENLKMPIRFKRRTSGQFRWSTKSTSLLLQLWSENIKELLKGGRSLDILKNMADHMSHLGVTSMDIKDKIDDTIEKYREEENKEKLTGKPSKWIIYKRVRKLLSGVENKAKHFDNKTFLNRNLNYETPLEIKSEQVEEVVNNAGDQEDELARLKDNIIKDIEASLENYEEELDSQTSTENPTKRAHFHREARLLEIEEKRLVLEGEKLVIEKEKLEVLKTLVKEISLFRNELSKAFIPK